MKEYDLLEFARYTAEDSYIIHRSKVWGMDTVEIKKVTMVKKRSLQTMDG